VLDFSEDEYGYRIMKAGYKSFVNQDAVLPRRIRGNPSLISADLKIGPKKVRAHEFPPLRCYYYCRNALYFILYEFEKGRVGLLSGALWRMRPHCLRGTWHGVSGNIAARY
jgi:hypothetical protein